jgi:hypothetical protein
MLPTVLLGLLHPAAAIPGMLAAALLLVAFAGDVMRVRPPRRTRGAALRFRTTVAAMFLLQPLARAWGRRVARSTARRQAPAPHPLPRTVHSVAGGALLLPADGPREQTTAALVGHLRRSGLRPVVAAEWADHDAVLRGSLLLRGELLTSGHPAGWVHARVRTRPRLRRLCAVIAISAALATLAPIAAASLLTVAAADAARGAWRLGPGFRRMVRRAAASHAKEQPAERLRTARAGLDASS